MKPDECIRINEKLSFGELRIQISRVGADYFLLLEGGTKPHIGCAALAVPRKSLTGDGSMSSTASVLNVTGHKDDVLCRLLAERVSAEKGAVAVCCGGFHTDDITLEQIRELTAAADRIAEKIKDL